MLGADAPLRVQRGATWDVTGSARLRLVGLRDFALDELGTTAGRVGYLESRLIAGGWLDFTPKVGVTIEIEALNGQVTGGFTQVGTARGADTFHVARHERFGGSIILPRKAFVRIDFSAGRLQIGQQAFRWGMGLVAEDGVGEPDFGDAYRGNLVERASFTARPFSSSTSEALRGLAVIAAADLIFRDDNASLLDGDVAWSLVAGARIKTARYEAGVLEVMRRQRDRDDPGRPDAPHLNVFVTDGYGRVFLTDPRAPRVWQLEAEVAFIAGETTRSYLEETARDGASVRSFGGAGRLRYDDAARRLTAKLEAGYAGGDNNPYDDVARQFTFNTDHQVGLILFDQALPMVTARSVDRAASPALLAVPPAGARHLVNQGAVANAIYLFPTARIRPTPALDVRAGYLFAASAADIADPYATAENGGYNAGFGGEAKGARALGHELDLSLRYGFDLGAGVELRVGYEAGVLFPGAAFDSLSERRPIWMARALTDASF